MWSRETQEAKCRTIRQIPYRTSTWADGPSQTSSRIIRHFNFRSSSRLQQMLHLRDVVRLSALFLAILGSLSTAIPTSRNDNARAIALPTRIEANGPRLHREVRSTLELPGYTTESLETRDWKIEYFDEGWALYFSAYQGFLKIENAAATLENFFVNIADQAAGVWLQH